MANATRVSVHGGHSGTYCGHARDALADIVGRYIELGFEWVCLTEHMPTQNPAFVPAEEAAAGLDVLGLQTRMDRYFAEARQLQAAHAHEIDILVGFETEAYTGYEAEVSQLIARHAPDIVVGSVHHLHDVLFDGGVDDYQRAARLAGGMEQLYIDYFDKQLELIERFQPAIVGHFDLIRLHDPDYRQRLELPRVRARALRNLRRIKALDLTLDLNVRALAKGADEPYLCEPLMAYAIDQGIAMAPGDDSHGIADVGRHLDTGISLLNSRGGSVEWRKPPAGRHRA